VIFLFGVHALETLDHLYLGFESLYEESPLVTIHTFETAIGSYKFDVSGQAAMSQAMVQVIEGLGLEINGEVATLLLSGIENNTAQFSSPMTSAETFEVVAKLMRAGARRIKKPRSGFEKISRVLPARKAGPLSEVETMSDSEIESEMS